MSSNNTVNHSWRTQLDRILTFTGSFMRVRISLLLLKSSLEATEVAFRKPQCSPIIFSTLVVVRGRWKHYQQARVSSDGRISDGAVVAEAATAASVPRVTPDLG